MGYFDRKIISIHDDDELNEAEVILKQTVNTTVRKLPLATFQEHEKQSVEDDDDDDDEDGGDQLTNQSVGGVQRARNLSEENPKDSLPAVYGGLFTVAEYFTRSFDAIKGKFFEKAVAAEEDSQRLDVDRSLGNLPQYLLEPELCWKSLDYTRETLTEDEEERLSGLDSLTLDLGENSQNAQSDATLFLEEDGILVFGEQRTSVVSGGLTARPSLIKKPRALIRELMKSNSVISISNDVATEYDISADSYSMAELLNEIGVQEIHFHIGILFNEKRTPATWEEDPQQSGSREALSELQEAIPTNLTKEPQNIEVDSDNLRLELDIPISTDEDETIPFHLSFLYGDIYLNSVYTGSLDAIGRDGSLDAFDSPRSLRGIISENEADDLWLAFSIAERESKVFEMSEENRNNAMEIADLILETDTYTERLVDLRQSVERGERETADEEILALAGDIAEEYNEQRENSYAEWVYGGDTVDYLRDVAIETIVSDLITRPLFLRRFPEPTQPGPDYGEDDVVDAALSDVRYAFETYLYEIAGDLEKKRKIEKKQDIFQIVRSQTRYIDSGSNIPDSETDEIAWEHAPTKSEVGDLLGIRTPTRVLKSMSEGTSKHKGGLLEKNGDKFAVPASVAHRMGRFMRNLPEDAEADRTQTRATDF